MASGGKLWISGIQKVETSIFLILDLIWVILNEIGCDSSFTGSVGLIIASSRSGTCFSSCLASSIYFFYNKKKSFSWGQLPRTYRVHFLQPISRPCSIEKVYPREWRIATPASLMQVEYCGISRSSAYAGSCIPSPVDRLAVPPTS